MSTRFWIQSLFKNFHSGERIQKVADSHARFTRYVVCITDTLWAKRGERSILREARDQGRRKALFFSCPRLALRAKSRVRLACLIKRLLCRLPDACGQKLYSERKSCYYFKTLYLKPERISTTTCLRLFSKLKILIENYFSPSLMFSVTQRFIFQVSKDDSRIKSF